MTTDGAAPVAASICMIQEGDTVVWDVNREKQSLLHVKTGGWAPPPPTPSPTSDTQSLRWHVVEGISLATSPRVGP